MKDLDSVLAQFSPVKIVDEVKKHRLMKLENSYKDMAAEILDLCPNNATRVIALQHLLQSKMVATHALTHEDVSGEKKS
jgi:hypothetical protein